MKKWEYLCVVFRYRKTAFTRDAVKWSIYLAGSAYTALWTVQVTAINCYWQILLHNMASLVQKSIQCHMINYYPWDHKQLPQHAWQSKVKGTINFWVFYLLCPVQNLILEATKLGEVGKFNPKLLPHATE